MYLSAVLEEDAGRQVDDGKDEVYQGGCIVLIMCNGHLSLTAGEEIILMMGVEQFSKTNIHFILHTRRLLKSAHVFSWRGAVPENTLDFGTGCSMIHNVSKYHFKI
jgi:hypothetical protein